MDGDILDDDDDDDDDGGRGGRPVLSLLSLILVEEEDEAGAAALTNEATLSNEWYCVRDTPPAIDDDVIDKSSLSAIMAVGSDDDMLDSFVLNCMLSA